MIENMKFVSIDSSPEIKKMLYEECQKNYSKSFLASWSVTQERQMSLNDYKWVRIWEFQVWSCQVHRLRRCKSSINLRKLIFHTVLSQELKIVLSFFLFERQTIWMWIIIFNSSLCPWPINKNGTWTTTTCHQRPLFMGPNRLAVHNTNNT